MGAALSAFRGVPVTYWVMDINPDQAVALGQAQAGSLPVRLMDWQNRQILKRASDVVPLDPYMAERLRAKGPIPGRVDIMPPWPHVDADNPPLAHDDNSLRREWDLSEKRVVMYSGNLSPSHPIDTIVDAAARVADDPKLHFLFVGGGQARRDLETAVAARGLDNVTFKPYQPLEKLRESLSVADVHLVSMGDAMVGVVHPCKVYGAMAVGRPVLALAPEKCHLTDIVGAHGCGWQVRHGDVDGVVDVLREIASAPQGALDDKGRAGLNAVKTTFSPRALMGQFCDVLERA